ncbi:hypothetical protein [Sinorhizobium americanum]|uniref:Uncharacterized protein n=1 Tax=Sinorhizobium americanum TaxID=194963 RepID=A0A1L3LU99_9HYPH|nr:hypothetical protein [Sinorhizobium americanum]APG87122.1 hypothetical protein SAMCCGM7_pB0407 [Sinorhizobium americanum CCGM7]APG93636.1 hypothetical protein SAMCFNEI73_pB0440 [Sinorhizobium americanum]OAP43969.1 hypothetical protein ATC00_27930 [Sinorhizobium americanum]
MHFPFGCGALVDSLDVAAGLGREEVIRLEQMRDNTLHVTNQLKAIFAELYRARYGTTPISFVLGSES